MAGANYNDRDARWASDRADCWRSVSSWLQEWISAMTEPLNLDRYKGRITR